MEEFPTLTTLIHGPSKTGKTTVACTSPTPICIIDAEGSSKFIQMRKKFWDPLREAPPEADGSWDAAIVKVTGDFRVIQETYEHLNRGQHGFKSVVVDSVSEVQRRLKKSIAGGGSFTEATAGKNGFAPWGKLLEQLDDILRNIRDLTEHQTNPLNTATFICETVVNKDGRWVPNLQGGIKDNVSYYFDLVGFLTMKADLDDYDQVIVGEDGKALKHNEMLIVNTHPSVEAGERVQGRLPDVIANPNITDMLVKVHDLKG